MMLTIPEISKQFHWVEPVQDEDVVLVNAHSLCLDLQTSFKNSISTVEEVASAVFKFFDDIDSRAVIRALQDGVFDFGKEQNRLLINLFATWIKKSFYDIREFSRFVVSKEMLGTLIELKQNETKIELMRKGFFVAVILALAVVFGLTYLGYSVDHYAVIALSIAIASVMGFVWNKLLKKQDELTAILLS